MYDCVLFHDLRAFPVLVIPATIGPCPTSGRIPPAKAHPCVNRIGGRSLPMLFVPALVALHSPELPSGESQLAAPAAPPAVSAAAPPKRGQWGRKSPGRPHFTKGMVIEVNVRLPKKKPKQEKQQEKQQQKQQKPLQPVPIYLGQFPCRTSDDRQTASSSSSTTTRTSTRRPPPSSVGQAQAYSINAAAYCARYGRASRPSISEESSSTWPSSASFWQSRAERPQSPPTNVLARTLNPDLLQPRCSLDQYNFRQELARQRRARHAEGPLLVPEQRQHHGAEAVHRPDGRGDSYSSGRRLSVSAHAYARIRRGC